MSILEFLIHLPQFHVLRYKSPDYWESNRWEHLASAVQDVESAAVSTECWPVLEASEHSEDNLGELI